MRVLFNSFQKAHFAVDKDNKIFASRSSQSAESYETLMTSEAVIKRYGLYSESITGQSQLDSKLDRAITGIETEIGLKTAECKRLMD